MRQHRPRPCASFPVSHAYTAYSCDSIFISVSRCPRALLRRGTDRKLGMGTRFVHAGRRGRIGKNLVQGRKGILLSPKSGWADGRVAHDVGPSRALPLPTYLPTPTPHIGRPGVWFARTPSELGRHFVGCRRGRLLQHSKRFPGTPQARRWRRTAAPDRAYSA